MIYLKKDDLITHAFEVFINESSNDFDETLNNIEAENIELIKSYIGTRYDVKEIFSILTPIRNPLLTRILSKLTLFDIIRRNAARKVPIDYKEDYDKALELLEKIATGRIKVDGLPLAVDDNGNIISNSLWGNNSNTNYFI